MQKKKKPFEKMFLNGPFEKKKKLILNKTTYFERNSS